MSSIGNVERPLIEILNEQYPYIKDFKVSEEPKLVVTYSHTGDIDESFRRLMSYINPKRKYTLVRLNREAEL